MGMKEPAPPIGLVAPTPSILTSARDLGAPNWKNGVAWTPTLCLQTYSWPWCPSPGTTKQRQNSPASVATEPFRFYTPIECGYVTDEQGTRFETMVTAATEAHTAAAVGAALWMGTGLSGLVDDQYGAPPTLRRCATDVSVGGLAAPVDDAVAALLHAYANATGGVGGAVLHVPDVLIVSCLGGGGGGARVCWPEGNIYRGPLGAVVSPGPGYPHGHSPQGANGFGPLASGTLAAGNEVYKGTAYNEVWLYVSGPVEYATDEITAFAESDLERRWLEQNRYEVIAERDGIVRIDPCGVFAAKAVNDAGEVS